MTAQRMSHPLISRRLTIFAVVSAAFSLAAPAVYSGGSSKTTVTVTVVGPEGKPVPGAPVFLMTPSKGDAAAVETKTDAQGRVSFEAPRAVVVAPPAPLGMGAGGFDGKGGPHIIRLMPATTVRGHVIDAANKPLAGAAVRPSLLLFESAEGEAGGVFYLPLPEALAEKLKTVSGPDGGFTIAGMPLRPGSLIVTLGDERYAAAQAKLPLQIAEPNKLIEPLVAKPGAILRGRVLNTVTGRPAAGIRVMAQGINGQNGWSEAKTGADGSYTLIGLPEGRFNVVVDDPSKALVAAALEDVKAIPSQITSLEDLRLTPGGFVTGRLLDAETKQPIGKGTVGVHGPHRPDSSGMVDSGDIASDGTYRVRVPAGTSKVYLMALPQEYLYDQNLLPVTIAEGQTKTIDFVLKKGLSVEGILVDEVGHPVPHKNLVASQGYERQVHTSTDEKGRFTARGLAPGEVRFAPNTFWNTNTSAFSLTGTVTAVLPATEPVRLVLCKPDPAARLTGRVVDSKGQPVAGARVEVMVVVMTGDFGSGSKLPVVESDADGRFTTDPVSPGGTIQSVKVTKTGYAFRTGGVVSPVKPDAPPKMTDIILTRLSGVVTGTIQDTKGRPVAGARVLSLSGGGAGADTVTDTAGRFTLKDVPEGEVAILAGRDGAGIAMTTVAPGAAPPLLTLSPMPRPATGTVGNVEQAAALAEEALRDPASQDFYARKWLPLSFAAYAPERAKVMAEKYKAGSAMSVDSAVHTERASSGIPSRQQLAEWTLPKLAAITDAYTRITTTLNAARVLASFNPVTARQLYRQARLDSNEHLNTDEALWLRVYLYTDLAAASAVLGEIEQARRDVNAALEATDGMKTTDEADDFRSAIVTSLAEKGSPSLADPVLARIGEKKRGFTYFRAISASAQQSPASAQRLLARAESTGAFDTAGGSSQRSMSQRYLVEGLATREPDAALALARKIGERSERGKALSAVAAKLPKARAAEVYREAAASVTGQSDAWEILARAGRDAMAVDPALGSGLLAKARDYAEAMRRTLPDYAEKYRGIVSWAFYAAQVTPVASRMALEQAWTAQEDSDVRRNSERLTRIALAMAPVDTERAIELARKMPAGGARLDALRKLAQYLAAPPVIRRTIPLNRWSASDTWTPGTPAGW